MEIKVNADVTYTTTVTYTDEERQKMARAIAMLNRMLPEPDDGLNDLYDIFAYGARTTYREAYLELGDLTFGGERVEPVHHNWPIGHGVKEPKDD